MTARELFNLVGDKIFWIRFEKANGEIRDMTCRIRPGGAKDPNPIVVFDLDKSAIRSFKLERVIELRIQGQSYSVAIAPTKAIKRQRSKP